MGMGRGLGAAVRSRRGGPNALERYQAAMEGEEAREGRYVRDERRSRSRYLDLLNDGQGAFESSARAAVNAAMPGFQEELQHVRESAMARGVANGETAVGGEYKAADRFEKNVSNAIAGQAMNLYGTRLGASQDIYGMDVGRSERSRDRYLDLVGGRMEYDLARNEQKARNRRGEWGAIGGFANTAASLFGGMGG